ncbi:MAG: hypothetical protein AB7E60_06995 [Sphingobium sp.]
MRNITCRAAFLLPLAALALCGCSESGDATAAQADTPSASSTPSGEAVADAAITGTIDGQPVSWSLWTTQSDYTGGEKNATVSFMGWKGKGPDDFGHIAIGFELRDGSPVNQEISLNDGDENRSYYLVPSSDEAITVLSVGKVKDELRLTGLISGEVGYSEDNGQTISADRRHKIELEFKVRLNGLSH